MRDNKEKIIEKTEKLVELTSKFCIQYLDEDYEQLCKKLILKMSRKREVPFLSGRIEIWAASIIHAIGSINFLFDKSFNPYATAEDICKYFGTSKSTTSQKAKLIRDMFKLESWDKEFSSQYMIQNNPFKDLGIIDGFIVNTKPM